MVGYLIKRPIAVFMSFLGIIALGLVAGSMLPVSLMPDVDIPRITVRVDAPAYSARELENAVMDRLRMHLMQVDNLDELRSEARDGRGLISLEFLHGTNVDLAYIEVNEQVDKTTPALPRDILRPAVIKASATDIPVFYLDISFRNPEHQSNLPPQVSEKQFLELSAFADEIIRRRLEQIPQVAMADMSGRTFPEIMVTPRMELLKAIGLEPEAIENTIREANLRLGNIILRDKQFRYHVRMGEQLLTYEDIANLYLHHEGRIWQLGELCHIETRVRETEGMVFSQNNRAISLAIIQQAGARMQDLKVELHNLVRLFEEDYPNLQFTVKRDQTHLLDITIDSLRQTLLLGALLAFGIMFVFLRDPRAPWIIMFSVPASLVVSLLFFYLAGISVNIISLSGLILGIGMMIDNSIIVIDNISRYRSQGKNIFDACVAGTHEVITPLLSSVLTTCAVFIPLIFISGIAGALFFDQAMAVTICLMVSLIIAITLIPVLYYTFYKNRPDNPKSFLKRLNPFDYTSIYSIGFRFVMRRQWVVWSIVALLVAMLVFLSSLIERERLPHIQRLASLVWIDWNEHIHVHENHRRVKNLIGRVDEQLVQSSMQIGRQQFLLEKSPNNKEQQSLVYLLARSEPDLEKIQSEIREFVHTYYPRAIVQFREEGNLFDQVFGDRQPPLELRLKPVQDHEKALAGLLQSTLDTLQQVLPGQHIDPVPLQQNIVLMADLELMALHQVEMSGLKGALSRIFRGNQVITLMEGSGYIPVNVGSNVTGLEEQLQYASVKNNQGVEIPLHLLLRRGLGTDLTKIVAGHEGVYYPVPLMVHPRQAESVMDTIRTTLRNENLFEAGFSGSIFAQRELMRELLLIAAVALMLLFFILAAQFESLKQPIIVLLEVPIALTGALIMLLLFGQTLNIMSMIGVVVMAGIIVNDSILKIATINRLRNGGMSLIRALFTAGHYRLKPILMTSITTIFALLPVLFVGGMGSDIQKPLALVVIGGLGLGTFVSLYFIPLIYYYLYRKEKG